MLYDNPNSKMFGTFQMSTDILFLICGSLQFGFILIYGIMSKLFTVPYIVNFRNIDGINFDNIEFKSISRLDNLRSIVYNKFYYCSMTPHIKRCRPNTDGNTYL